MRLRLVLLAVCAAGLLAPAGGAGRRRSCRPGNKVFWGGIGGYEQVEHPRLHEPVRQAPGRVRLLHQVEGQQVRLHWLGFRFEYAAAQRVARDAERGAAPGLSPGKIARGGGDGFLTAMTRMLAETARSPTCGCCPR